MGADKKLKVLIFEDDPIIAKLFQGLFVFQGHNVLVFSDPTTCPLFKNAQCDCPKNSPCGNVLIADMEMRHMTGLEFFELQRKRGCKAPDENKLLLGSRLTPEQRNTIKNLGCRFVKKPFNTYELVRWLESRKLTAEHSQCTDRS